MTSHHPYRGLVAGLLTQHGKEHIFVPPLREAFGLQVDLVQGVDTDRLGTFTRDVPRSGTQLQAARRKALLACDAGSTSLGLGSEGAFAGGAFGLGVWDLELVVLVDVERGVEMVGRACEPGLLHQATVRSLDELRAFALRAGFPDHGLVVRPDNEDKDDRRIRKGVVAWGDLEAAFLEAGEDAGGVWVESDLRAHVHPTRRTVIASAVRDLLERVSRLCPACRLPGFGKISTVAGLPCRVCATPTSQPVADVHGCVGCGHRDLRTREGQPPHAEPMRCPACNP
jgi:hypothetical protein